MSASLTAFAGAFFGVAIGATPWCVLAILDRAFVNPLIVPFVLLGL